MLIKAVAGGGGKGMRKVEGAADFADALASCQREATSSFGNAHVLIEKYIQRPRHIEVQVFGDTHGNIVHLFERDCSLQRRHQKVIEEAPAPGMDEATREQLCAVAVKAAKAVDYVGAGTIEFIADASEGLRADRIWFMEMNTRLQVEHPVTEEITGVDLVEWQLRVASGEVLPKRQDELSMTGHAIEARLYAEDPSKGFLPSVGRLDHFKIRSQRIESGVEEGSEISRFYDPMIAKLVRYADTRNKAISYLAGDCLCVESWPVKTNSVFLSNLLLHPEFRSGDIDTGFIERHAHEVVPPLETPWPAWETAAVQLTVGNNAPAEVGFRLNALPQTRVRLTDGNEEREVDLATAQNCTFSRAWGEDTVLVTSATGTVKISLNSERGSGGVAPSSGTILSPMPGRIIAVDVAAGDAVVKGQKLVTLEAMKMEHSLTAPFDGTVAELHAEAGGQVSEGMLLVRVEASEP